MPVGLGAADVSWANDIAPLLYRNCVECHRPGGEAPFALVRYEDAAKRARMLARTAASGFMPPWKPVAGWGEFHDERRLSDEEVKLLKTWADTGAASGDLSRAPAPPSIGNDGWKLGPPDLVLKMSDPFTVPANGVDVYRAFVLPFSVAQIPREAREAASIPDVVGVRAVEIRPGNPRVVHHALGYIDTSGEARRRDAADVGPGYTSFGSPGFKAAGYLGSYVPGYRPRPLPDGINEAMPVRGDAVLQIHYSPSGRDETDQTEIGIYFSRQPMVRAVVWWSLRETVLDIPAGAEAHTVRVSRVLPVESYVFSVLPHMHYLGKSVRAVAVLPESGTQRLLRIDDWDFNWQTKYEYRAPLRLPAGTRIEAEWTFDNTERNPRNPHTPPQRVVHGPNSTDEMCELHFNLVPVDPAGYPELGETIRGLERAAAEKVSEPRPATTRVVVRDLPSRDIPQLALRLVALPEKSGTKSFWIAQHETTQADYQQVMGANPSRFVDPSRPVERVSWNEAVEFCRRLTERERAAGRLPAGLAFRLPTEAEWELACRAGSTEDFSGTGVLGDMGWYAANSGRETKPVGQKLPNAWGLYDMHGNVWEWCLDRVGEQRAFRGGSAIGLASSCRSWSRSANAAGSRHFSLGFRVVLAPE